MENFEEMAFVSSCSDNMKCRRFPAFLTSSETDYYRTVIKDTLIAEDWRALKQAFLSCFQTIDQDTVARKLLMARTQAPQEPVHLYILEKQRLGKLIDPAITFQEMSYWIMKGMQPVIKSYLRQREVRNVESLITEARRIENSLAPESNSFLRSQHPRHDCRKR